MRFAPRATKFFPTAHVTHAGQHLADAHPVSFNVPKYLVLYHLHM